MKIALFIKSTTFHKGFGGLQTQNKSLCEELVKRGHSVSVFSPKLELTDDTLEENGVKYFFISSQYKRYLFAKFSKDSWANKSLKIFSEFHSKDPFDLVISQSSAGESIILNKDKFQIPVISISHGTALSEFKTFLSNMSLPKDFLNLLLNLQYFLRQYFGRQRRFVLGSNKVIAVSDIVKQLLVEETFIPDEKVVTIYNGVSKDFIDSVPVNISSDKSKINLIYIGRIEKSKGVFLLINILDNIEGVDFSLSFVGSGKDLPALKETVSRSRISNKVVFYSNLPRNEVIYKLKGSDILVFPTLRVEGFPMILVEAMMCSVPIVAFDNGGVRYGVRDSETGYLVGANDEEMFKQRLLELSSDKNLRLNMGKKGREWAEKEFTIEKMVNSYESVFKEVTN